MSEDVVHIYVNLWRNEQFGCRTHARHDIGKQFLRAKIIFRCQLKFEQRNEKEKDSSQFN